MKEGGLRSERDLSANTYRAFFPAMRVHQILEGTNEIKRLIIGRRI